MRKACTPCRQEILAPWHSGSSPRAGGTQTTSQAGSTGTRPWGCKCPPLWPLDLRATVGNNGGIETGCLASTTAGAPDAAPSAGRSAPAATARWTAAWAVWVGCTPRSGAVAGARRPVARPRWGCAPAAAAGALCYEVAVKVRLVGVLGPVGAAAAAAAGAAGAAGGAAAERRLRGAALARAAAAAAGAGAGAAGAAAAPAAGAGAAAAAGGGHLLWPFGRGAAEGCRCSGWR
ncbi:hypothetical protein DUNSADRAFT_11068, partial [Dunaliella salina]